MDKNKEIALELAKILIQKNNVVPVSTISNDSNEIQYNIDDVNYSFCEIASHFLESIDQIEEIQ